MNKLNHKGSILQIVLVIFMVLLTILTIALSMISLQMKSYKDIDILMQQKNLEIMLVRYYIENMKDDILISDSIEGNDYSVEYVVDDMGSYLSIETSISIKDIYYHMLMDIEKENLYIKKFEYREE